MELSTFYFKKPSLRPTKTSYMYYSQMHNFKRIGNEDICGKSIDKNVSIRDAFEQCGALNPPVEITPYIENSFGNKIYTIHVCIFIRNLEAALVLYCNHQIYRS